MSSLQHRRWILKKSAKIQKKNAGCLTKNDDCGRKSWTEYSGLTYDFLLVAVDHF